MQCRRPVSKDVFLEHFWWCHARLQEKSDSEYGMAAYFRFLTLLGIASGTISLHVVVA